MNEAVRPDAKDTRGRIEEGARPGGDRVRARRVDRGGGVRRHDAGAPLQRRGRNVRPSGDDATAGPHDERGASFAAGDGDSRGRVTAEPGLGRVELLLSAVHAAALAPI